MTFINNKVYNLYADCFPDLGRKQKIKCMLRLFSRGKGGFMQRKHAGFRKSGKAVVNKGGRFWHRMLFSILAAIAIMLSVGGFSEHRMSVQASAGKAEEAKKAFGDFLGKGYRGSSTGNSYDPSVFSFCCLEIGKDQTPVLIIQNEYASHADGYICIYQYVDGKVKCMANNDRLRLLYRKSGVIALERMGGGYGARDVTYYSLDGSNRLMECAYTSILYKKDWKDQYDELRKTNGPDQYSIRDQAVTKAEFSKFKKELIKGDKNKASKVKMRKNTEENRKKYLK